MARFFLALIALLALASFASRAQAAESGDQVVKDIQGLTQKSKALQAPAQSITITNGILIVVGQGPFRQIIKGFSEIIIDVSDGISEIEIDAQFDATDSDKISDAFREFVKVHQELLNILIGKAGLFTTVPFIGGPVAQQLRSLEGVLDTLAVVLVETCQSQAASLQDQQKSLADTLDACIQAYQGTGELKMASATA